MGGIASGKLTNFDGDFVDESRKNRDVAYFYPLVILLMNQQKTGMWLIFYTLVAGKWVIFCMAMENGPCIVDLPNLQMVFFAYTLW